MIKCISNKNIKKNDSIQYDTFTKMYVSTLDDAFSASMADVVL